MQNKKAKINETRKKAEAQKAKKKDERAKKMAVPATSTGKGKSIIGQSKTKKK